MRRPESQRGRPAGAASEFFARSDTRILTLLDDIARHVGKVIAGGEAK